MTKFREVSNSEDILDSRDIIARIEELENDRSEYVGEGEHAETRANEWRETDEGREHASLIALQSEAESSTDWKYGETLIRDSYFRDYAEELASDVCDMKSASTWPFCHIDWEAATDALKVDYFSVDFDGVDYWIRS